MPANEKRGLSRDVRMGQSGGRREGGCNDDECWHYNRLIKVCPILAKEFRNRKIVGNLMRCQKLEQQSREFPGESLTLWHS